MRNFLLSLALGIVALTGSAFAEEQIVRELPGNVTIATNPDRGPRGVIIYNDDESLLYRTLIAPHSRNRDLNVPNSASLDDVNSICGNARTASDKNRCIKDVIKEREKLNKRYNN